MTNEQIGQHLDSKDLALSPNPPKEGVGSAS